MKRNVFVLIRKQDCEMVGTWSNLKYLCEEMGKKTVFPSYWTLSRMDKESKQLGFTSKDGTEYKICISEI